MLKVNKQYTREYLIFGCDEKECLEEVVVPKISNDVHLIQAGWQIYPGHWCLEGHFCPIHKKG